MVVIVEQAPPGVDPQTPNAARMYDYYLGGKDNFAADRALADMVLSVAPEIREAAREGRELIGRVVRHLVAGSGITQIIDLGSGLPTQENVHEIARRIDPATRVVYVDKDEVAAAHGRALLSEPDKVVVVQGDLRRPREILDHPDVRRLIDFDQPVAVMVMFVLHLIPDEDRPQDVIAAYRDALAPGSYLAVSHASKDARPELMARISAIYERASSPFVPRSHAEIARFFGDFQLEPPGLVNIWPFSEPPKFMDADLARTGYGGVGKKPL